MKAVRFQEKCEAEVVKLRCFTESLCDKRTRKNSKYANILVSDIYDLYSLYHLGTYEENKEKILSEYQNLDTSLRELIPVWFENFLYKNT